MEIKIGNKKIGKGNPAFIIAELSANHNQDYDLAVKTIKAMKMAGADAVKLQTYTPDTMTLDSNQKDFLITQGTIWDGKRLYDLYKEAYMPWKWQPKLKKIAEKLGLICFSTPFDKTAVDFLEKMNVLAYKVASFEITDIPLIEYMASKQKPIIMSTGIAELEDINLALKTCKGVGNEQIALLSCTSAYPTPLEEVNLEKIPDMRRRFKTIVGLSDHTLGISVPIAAVALGAKIVEKHFILNRNIGGLDSKFSLEPAEFKEMVLAIRKVEKALGKPTYKLTRRARRSKEHCRSLYVAQDIKKGELFTKNNLRSVRPAFGLHPKYYEKILGKKSTKNLKKGTALKWECVKQG